MVLENADITQRPVLESLFCERTVWNYPEVAIRELLMNACMHRVYQANMPIRLYQFDDFRVSVHVTKDSDLSKGTSQLLSQSVEERIVEFCKKPQSGAEIAAYCGFKDVKYFRERYLSPSSATASK